MKSNTCPKCGLYYNPLIEGSIPVNGCKCGRIYTEYSKLKGESFYKMKVKEVNMLYDNSPLPSPSSESWVEQWEKLKADFIAVKQNEWWSSDEDFILSFIKNTITAEVERGRRKMREECCEKIIEVCSVNPATCGECVLAIKALQALTP
jgi:hypothetical protein